MEELLKEIRGFADKALSEETADYKPAIGVGLEALDAAKGFLEAVQSGDKEAIQEALTQWADVNETLAAVAKMDKAIADAEDGVQLTEVLEVIAKVAKIAVTFAALL